MKIKGIYCTECPYYAEVIYDEDGWYGAKCKRDGHRTNPSMYAIKLLHDDCPLTTSDIENDNEFVDYRQDVSDVLDEIRAEIEAKCCITVGRENDGAITLHDVFEIIDKYR